jgi:malonyl CoA-acyl carrier protein transacylase
LATQRIPVIQNTRPTAATIDAEEIREALSDQIVSPVSWTETMA